MSRFEHESECMARSTRGGEQTIKATDTGQQSFDQIHQTPDEQRIKQNKEKEDNQKSEQIGTGSDKLTAAKCAEPSVVHNSKYYGVLQADKRSEQFDPKPNEQELGQNEIHQSEQTKCDKSRDGHSLKQSDLNKPTDEQMSNKGYQKSDYYESEQSDNHEGEQGLHQIDANTDGQLPNRSDKHQEHQTLNQSHANTGKSMPNITDVNQDNGNNRSYLYSALFKPYDPKARYKHELSEEDIAIEYEDAMYDEFETDDDTHTPFVYFTVIGKDNDIDEMIEMDKYMEAGIDMRTANVTRLPDIDIGTTRYGDEIHISGMGFIPPRSLAVVDSDNDQMKVIDVVTNKLTSQIGFPHTPYDITVINDELAVTLPMENEIALISLQAIDTFDAGRIPIRYLKVEGQCYGLAAVETNLVVAFPDQKKVEIIDLEGHVLVSLMRDCERLFRCPTYVAVSKEEFGEFIYVSDCESNVVTKISKLGDVIEKYRHRKWDRILGLACVGDSLLVVNQWGVKDTYKDSTGISSDIDDYDDEEEEEYPTVDVASDGGQVITTVLDESNGLKLPKTLCYIESLGRLYVSGEFSTGTKLMAFSITKQSRSSYTNDQMIDSSVTKQRKHVPDTNDQMTQSKFTKESEQVPDIKDQMPEFSIPKECKQTPNKNSQTTDEHGNTGGERNPVVLKSDQNELLGDRPEDGMEHNDTQLDECRFPHIDHKDDDDQASDQKDIYPREHTSVKSNTNEDKLKRDADVDNWDKHEGEQDLNLGDTKTGGQMSTKRDKHQGEQTSNQSDEITDKSMPNKTVSNQNERNKEDSEAEYEEEKYDDFKTDEETPIPFGYFTVLGKVNDIDRTIEADKDIVPDIDIKTANVTRLPDIDLGPTRYGDEIHISGMVFIPPRSLAVLDNNNDQMKVIDVVTNKLASQIGFPNQPWDITVINDELAITLPMENVIALISLQAKASLNVGGVPIRYLTVDGQCYGIAAIESNLVVAFQDPGKVEIIGLEGHVLASIVRDCGTLFRCPTYVTVSKEEFSEFIYVSDCESNVVTKISKLGEVIGKYRHKTWDRILGLAYVGDSLLVVNQWGVKETNKESMGISSDTDDEEEEYPTVDIVSDGGHVITTLLDESHGLILPKTLCYNESLGRLYVSGKFSTGTPLMTFSITKQSEQMPETNDQMADFSATKQGEQVPDINDQMKDFSVPKESQQTLDKNDQMADEQGIIGGERNPDVLK